MAKRASRFVRHSRMRHVPPVQDAATRKRELPCQTPPISPPSASTKPPYTQLDVFDRPEHVVEVVLTGDELTAFCPITHQPDFYRYEVRYRPGPSCIESKTFKLLIASFREQAAFAETLASDLAQLVHDATGAETDVTLTQQVRGGISITAKASIPRPA
jgi:7-cyano-7-deazaguanine reductase